MAVGASEGLAALLKEHLLSVLCNLLSNFGPIASRRGPLDAQIAFLTLLQECDFTTSNITRGVEIIVKIGKLFPHYSFTFYLRELIFIVATKIFFSITKNKIMLDLI